MDKTIKELKEGVQNDKDIAKEATEDIMYLFESALARAKREERERIEKILYTENGFLREDENLASDILSTLSKKE